MTQLHSDQHHSTQLSDGQLPDGQLPGGQLPGGQFHSEIRSRIDQTRTSLGEASAARDDYLVEVRLGELETLARLAAENGVTVEGIDETFAAHGRQTPPLGMARVVDVRALPRFAT